MTHVLARISWDKDTVSSLSPAEPPALHNMSLSSMERCRLSGVGFVDWDETWFVSAKRQAASGSSLRHSGLGEALQSSFQF